MAYAGIEAGEPIELPVGIAFELNSEQFPANWLDNADLSERTGRLIYEIIEPDDPPAGRRVASYALDYDADSPASVTREATLEDIPLADQQAAAKALVATELQFLKTTPFHFSPAVFSITANKMDGQGNLTAIDSIDIGADPASNIVSVKLAVLAKEMIDAGNGGDIIHGWRSADNAYEIQVTAQQYYDLFKSGTAFYAAYDNHAADLNLQIDAVSTSGETAAADIATILVDLTDSATWS